MFPFAEELGVAAPFVRHIGRLAPEACGWLHDAEREIRTPEEFYRLYCEIFSAVRGESVRPAAPPARRAPAPRPVPAASAPRRPQRPHRRSEYDYDEY